MTIYGCHHYDEEVIAVDAAELWGAERMSGVVQEAIVCLSGTEGWIQWLWVIETTAGCYLSDCWKKGSCRGYYYVRDEIQLLQKTFGVHVCSSGDSFEESWTNLLLDLLYKQSGMDILMLLP